MRAMRDVLALILAGGQGDRLSVLSEQRAKPAVVFGGQYRIVDFALSNCTASDIDRVAVLTQYRPRSLVNHIASGRAWGYDTPDRNIEILQPYLGRADMDWYQGTADAVYQNLYLIAQSRAEEVLILSADHVYLMSYRNLVAYHRRQQADVTMGVVLGAAGGGPPLRRAGAGLERKDGGLPGEAGGAEVDVGVDGHLLLQPGGADRGAAG